MGAGSLLALFSKDIPNEGQSGLSTGAGCQFASHSVATKCSAAPPWWRWASGLNKKGKGVVLALVLCYLGFCPPQVSWFV